MQKSPEHNTSTESARRLGTEARLEAAEATIRSLQAHNRALLHELEREGTQRVEQYLDRRRLNALVQNAPMCVHEIGLDGCVQSMNPSGLSMLNSALPSAVVGVPYLGFVGAEDKTRVAQLMKDAFTGHASEFEFTATSGERIRTFASSFVPIFDELGNVERLMGCTREITERLELEAARADLSKQVLHVQKLESLGLLASGVAHDFNNMLTAVMANVELAKLKLEADHTAVENLTSAQTAVTLGAELCKQLLAYAGQRRFEIAPYDLSQAAGQVAAMLRASLPSSVDLDVQTGSDVVVDACGGEIDQIILNLIVNASDALVNSTGKIHVEVSRVEIDSEAIEALVGGPILPGNYGLISVADEGHGIPAHIADKIFDPFFSTKSEGRGLGLAAVGGIVRDHNGYLLLETAEGEGTRFSVYLPLSNTPL